MNVNKDFNLRIIFDFQILDANYHLWVIYESKIYLL